MIEIETGNDLRMTLVIDGRIAVHDYFDFHATCSANDRPTSSLAQASKEVDQAFTPSTPQGLLTVLGL